MPDHLKSMQVILEKFQNPIKGNGKAASGRKRENQTIISVGTSKQNVLNIKGLRGDLGEINEGFEYFR